MTNWETCVQFHGHACGGLTIGYKAACYAAELLELSFSGDEQVVCIAENDACGVDAIQALLGCIALRRLDGTTCELKRLYVRPAFRGRGIAGAMMQRILDDARAIGYTAMLLDTLPFLTSAIRMYRALGFYDIPPYNDSPLDTTIFLRLDL